MTSIKRFGLFWYDFVIGDDWRMAAGVVLALAVAAEVAQLGGPGWIVVPLAVALLLGFSVIQATRSKS